MNSLRQLEAVDINILTELAGNLEKFVKCAGITVSTSQRKELEQCATNIDRLEVIIDMWVSGESRYWSPTWSALETVLFRVGLTRLAEQISGYFGKCGVPPPPPPAPSPLMANCMIWTRVNLGSLKIKERKAW